MMTVEVAIHVDMFFPLSLGVGRQHRWAILCPASSLNTLLGSPPMSKKACAISTPYCALPVYSMPCWDMNSILCPAALLVIRSTPCWDINSVYYCDLPVHSTPCWLTLSKKASAACTVSTSSILFPAVHSLHALLGYQLRILL